MMHMNVPRLALALLLLANIGVNTSAMLPITRAACLHPGSQALGSCLPVSF